jgi:hypothetical protein
MAEQRLAVVRTKLHAAVGVFGAFDSSDFFTVTSENNLDSALGNA